MVRPILIDYQIALFRRLDSAKVLASGEEDRPVPLRKVVLSEALNTSNKFLYDKHLNYRLPEIIKDYSNGKPVLIVSSFTYLKILLYLISFAIRERVRKILQNTSQKK